MDVKTKPTTTIDAFVERFGEQLSRCASFPASSVVSLAQTAAEKQTAEGKCLALRLLFKAALYVKTSDDAHKLAGVVASLVTFDDLCASGMGEQALSYAALFDAAGRSRLSAPFDQRGPGMPDATFAREALRFFLPARQAYAYGIKQVLPDEGVKKKASLLEEKIIRLTDQLINLALDNDRLGFGGISTPIYQDIARLPSIPGTEVIHAIARNKLAKLTV